MFLSADMQLAGILVNLKIWCCINAGVKDAAAKGVKVKGRRWGKNRKGLDCWEDRVKYQQKASGPT